MWWRRASGSSVGRRQLTVLIDESAVLEGKFHFSGTAMLNGEVRGEIVSTGALIIGEHAVLQGEIRAASVVISGQLTGNVLASERLELRGKARVVGNLEAPVLAIAPGVVFDGHCRMSHENETASGRDGCVVPLKQSS